MLINSDKRTITFKIVYYGTMLSGKTTNLHYLSQKAQHTASDILILETRGSRTLYFDELQLSFGEIGGYKTNFKLYTTAGQMAYIASRRLVLKGADAIVFVMDSQQSRLRDNLRAWYTMERQLLELNKNKSQIPIVIQLNKRDMPFIAPVHQLLSLINSQKLPHVEAAANQGLGVFSTLQQVIELLVAKILNPVTSDQSDAARIGMTSDQPDAARMI